MFYSFYLLVYNIVFIVFDYKSLLFWFDKIRLDFERGLGRFFVGLWINLRLYFGFIIGKYIKLNLKKKW